MKFSFIVGFAKNFIYDFYLKPMKGPCLLIINHHKKLALTNKFYLTFFLNSIGLLVKKEKNHNNVI